MSNWFTSLFSSGAASLVDSVGSAIDSLVTSDEERLQLKNELNAQIHAFKNSQLEAQAKYDKEITERWKSDNEHTFTRLVRPISFSFVLFLFACIVLFDGNIGTFSINPAYIPVIEGLLYTMVIAYFGSRGAEKLTKTIKNNQ